MAFQIVAFHLSNNTHINNSNPTRDMDVSGGVRLID